MTPYDLDFIPQQPQNIPDLVMEKTFIPHEHSCSATEFVKNKLLETRLADSLKQFFLSEREAIIFGAGHQASAVFLFCMLYSKKVRCCMTSSSTDMHPELIGGRVDLFTVDDFNGNAEDFDVVLAVNEKWHTELEGLLREKGFPHIFSTDNWCRDNDILRESFGDNYIAFAGGTFSQHPEYGRIVTFPLCSFPGQVRPLRFVYPQTLTPYKASMINMFFSVMIRTMFDDERFYMEASQELPPHVSIANGDVVFDCGAHIGSVAMLAAAKGAVVHAFEPVEAPLIHLRANASFYDTITLVPKAASEVDGNISFWVGDGQREIALGSSLALNENGAPYTGTHAKKTTIASISLDSYVEQLRLEKVDFIKADIEGAERNMLRGAKKVLAKFAPKLSICTYHLKDDPLVLEKLILEANPEYVVHYNNCAYSKLFAYVPQ